MGNGLDFIILEVTSSVTSSHTPFSVTLESHPSASVSLVLRAKQNPGMEATW